MHALMDRRYMGDELRSLRLDNDNLKVKLAAN